MACNMNLSGEHGFSSNLYFELENKDRTTLKTKGHKIAAKFNNTAELRDVLCGTVGTYGLIVAQEEKSQGQ